MWLYVAERGGALKKLLLRTDKWEDGLRGVLFRFRLPLFVIVVTLLAFWARTFFWPYVSMDFWLFLDDWLNQIRTGQGFHTIGSQIGNYTAPYHYLLAAFTYIPGLNNLEVIKITSTLADFAMAAGAALVVCQFTRNRMKGVIAYCLALCLPTVFLNSAAWGQCDAMYTALLLFCIWFWLRGQKALCMVMLGLALAVKLQAVFLLPAFVIFWLCGRLRLRHLLCTAGAYVGIMLPAVIGARSPAPLLAPYTMQTKVHTLAANIPSALSMFNNFDQDAVYMFTGGLTIFALLLLGALAYYCWCNRAYFTRQSEFILLVLCACLVPFILPGMRDRYFYVAEVLTLCYVLAWPRRALLPILLQLASLPGYVGYLAGGTHGFGTWLAVVAGLPALVLFWDLYRHIQATKSAPLPAQAAKT